MLGDRDSERFYSKILVAQDRGCWEWTGARDKDGYGLFQIGGRLKKAHRICYEDRVAPIPTGLVIDHVSCENTRCVNPDHLRVCTCAENTLRSASSPSAVNARKVQCLRGHDLSDAYMIRSKGGVERRCRTCSAEKYALAKAEHPDRFREYARRCRAIIKAKACANA